MTKAIRTEHNGAKNGGGHWGTRHEAKVLSKKLRRRAGKLAALKQSGRGERMTHTPGPWDSQYDDNGFFCVNADGAPSPYIVATGGEGDADRANARLIAAAPALLAALQTTAGNLRSIMAADNHRTYDEWLAVVDAAIGQAEGN